MNLIIKVAIPGPLRQCFDYYSKECNLNWQQGMRVSVPFGSRKLIGFVLAITKVENNVDLKSLKAIEKRLDDKQLIPQSIIDLILWTSDYYHHPIGDCFQVALPKFISNGKQSQINQEIFWVLCSDINNEQNLGKKQQSIIKFLKSKPSNKARQTELFTHLGQCRSSLLSLEKKGLIEQQQGIKQDDINSQISDAISLNDEQQQAVDTVWKDDQKFSPFLLQGITGSGKTEVYIHLAKKVLAENKQVLILIPEIGLTEQFVQRFKQKLSAHIVVLNSSISDKERTQAWLLANEGLAQIVIGTRSAVFTPLPNLGLIIIDEEHDSSYKQQDSLRYHARTFALVRAKKQQIPIVLGSATPSIETLHHSQKQRYQILKLSKRATGANLPKIRLINSNGPKAADALSSELFKAIKAEITANNQVLLFINRRGYAPVLMCHQCSWQANCQHCDAKMIVHQHRYQLRCHHCGAVQNLLTQCPSCSSADLTTYGAGTQQIEQKLQGYFPEARILRIDKDSTQRVGAFEKIVNEIQQGGAKILVGTQMLAKGHDFHDVTLVGVLDADQGLFSADFRATESLAQLITQVTGRAGRGKKPGTVYIQTSQVDHPFWKNMIEHDYDSAAKKLLQERSDLEMPPYGSLCVIRSRAKEQEISMQFLMDVAEILRQTEQQDVLILGPVPAIMEKRAGYFRSQLLLTSKNRKRLHQLLDHHIDQISALKQIRKLKWSIDIDPIDLL